MNKKYLIPMAAVVLLGAGAYGVSQVSAASSTTPGESLVQKIADTFHLDKAKVQAVFDQNKSDRQADMETKYEARLTQAVTDGKLTSSQKDLVLVEHKKLQTETTAAMAKTGTDRRTAMDAVRTEGEAWAKANNIDAKWLLGGGGGMGRGHMGGMMRHDNDADDAPATGTSTN